MPLKVDAGSVEEVDGFCCIHVLALKMGVSTRSHRQQFKVRSALKREAEVELPRRHRLRMVALRVAEAEPNLDEPEEVDITPERDPRREIHEQARRTIIAK